MKKYRFTIINTSGNMIVLKKGAPLNQIRKIILDKYPDFHWITTTRAWNDKGDFLLLTELTE